MLTEAISKTSNPRILGLDLLRGYFMFMIIVNHIGRFPSIYDIFTGRGLFWVSAAEGFFMIAGLLIGYVYGPKFINNAKKTTKKLWLRSGKLYLWSVFFTLLFTLLGLIAGMPPGTKPGLLQTNIFNLIYQTLTLHYVYGWADFLVRFVVFIFFAPIALYFITKNKWWLVLIASCLIWIFRGNSFNMAWQILFFVGIILGYYLPTIEKRFNNLNKSLRTCLRYSVISLACLLISFNAILIYFSIALKNPSSYISTLPNPYSTYIASLNTFYNYTGMLFEKNSLGIGRLILDVICFLALYFIVRKNEIFINKMSLGFFETLGKRPLFIYCLSAVIIYPLQILIMPLPSNIIYNFILDTVILSIIYLAARYRDCLIRTFKTCKASIFENIYIIYRRKVRFEND